MKNNFKKTCLPADREVAWLLKEKYFGKEAKQFFVDVKRLQAGEPVDYVIGFTEFLGCKIDLSRKPLIPRPETAFWVKKATDEINLIVRQNTKKQIKVLDIFSGSGCVGVALLKNCEMTFADNDKNAILQIKKNCKINNIDKKRYKVVKSDIFKNLKIKKFKNYFDIILANPPYIPTKNKNKVGTSVLKYEPKQALFGGNDGLFYIKKFLKQANNYLVDGGIIYIEFDPPQKNAINKLLKNFGYQSWQFHKDQFNKYRFVEIK